MLEIICSIIFCDDWRNLQENYFARVAVDFGCGCAAVGGHFDFFRCYFLIQYKPSVKPPGRQAGDLKGHGHLDKSQGGAGFSSLVERLASP
ncbi:hypothetical protein [Caldithrix abyssi]|uniref:hypothetical protein n=1 Tax=Caldithrix abyssi TaxID=187145 RepID=UPI0012373919|nr:hypothetical protein [Caldithrix abyssi]